MPSTTSSNANEESINQLSQEYRECSAKIGVEPVCTKGNYNTIVQFYRWNESGSEDVPEHVTNLFVGIDYHANKLVILQEPEPVGLIKVFLKFIIPLESLQILEDNLPQLENDDDDEIDDDDNQYEHSCLAELTESIPYEIISWAETDAEVLHDRSRVYLNCSIPAFDLERGTKIRVCGHPAITGAILLRPVLCGHVLTAADDSCVPTPIPPSPLEIKKRKMKGFRHPVSPLDSVSSFYTARGEWELESEVESLSVSESESDPRVLHNIYRWRSHIQYEDEDTEGEEEEEEEEGEDDDDDDEEDKEEAEAEDEEEEYSEEITQSYSPAIEVTDDEFWAQFRRPVYSPPTIPNNYDYHHGYGGNVRYHQWRRGVGNDNGKKGMLKGGALFQMPEDR